MAGSEKLPNVPDRPRAHTPAYELALQPRRNSERLSRSLLPSFLRVRYALALLLMGHTGYGPISVKYSPTATRSSITIIVANTYTNWRKFSTETTS